MPLIPELVSSVTVGTRTVVLSESDWDIPFFVFAISVVEPKIDESSSEPCAKDSWLYFCVFVVDVGSFNSSRLEEFIVPEESTVGISLVVSNSSEVFAEYSAPTMIS